MCLDLTVYVVRRSRGGGLQGSVLPALTSAPLSGTMTPFRGDAWATLSTTMGITTSYSKNVVRLMYDRSFLVNRWLTAGMIYLLPLISVPSLDSVSQF